MATAHLPINSTNVRSLIALQSTRLGLGAMARMSPSLALRWLEKLFLSPEKHPWPEAEKPWLASAQISELRTAGLPLSEWDGKAMRVYRWGEARRGKMVLMHGWSGRATQFHKLIGPLVEAGYQVVAIDAPGHGGSEGDRSSVLHFVNALVRLVRNEGRIEAIVAHSMGGAATINALRMANLDVGRVALIAPSADLGAYARYVGRLLRLGSGLLAKFQQRVETRFGIRWADLNAVTHAAHLRQPALIVHDQGDREVSAETGSAIAAAWAGSRFQLTQGLGHRRILRDDEVVRRVVAFVTEAE